MIVCLNKAVRLAMIHEPFSDKSAGLDPVVFRFDADLGSNLHLFSISSRDPSPRNIYIIPQMKIAYTKLGCYPALLLTIKVVTVII